MTIERLDHYSIRTTDVETTRKFYTEALGLEVGPRPDFPFPGVWLYQGPIAVVHVVGIDKNDTAGLRDYLGDRPAQTETQGTGSPGTGSPGTGSPGTGSPGTGSPGTGSPGTGSPGTGSPGTGSPGTGSPGTGSPGTGSPGTGSIDHVAFLGRDVDAMRAHFQSAAIAFRERTVPTMNLKQIFIDDPNGITIELNFPQ